MNKVSSDELHFENKIKIKAQKRLIAAPHKQHTPYEQYQELVAATKALRDASIKEAHDHKQHQKE